LSAAAPARIRSARTRASSRGLTAPVDLTPSVPMTSIGRLRDRSFDSPIALVLGLTGAYCGWQAVIATAIFGLLLAIIAVIAWQIMVGILKKPWPFPPISFWISVAAVIHLLVWRQWTQVPQLPGPETPWWAWLIYLAMSLKP